MDRSNLSLFVDELLLQANPKIVDYISQHATVKRVGSKYVALCPFHSEKTPSFKIDVDKGLYYCFGCGSGGNLITFLMQKERLDFIDAVRYLADREGIRLGNDVLRDNERSVRSREVLEVARSFFASNKGLVEEYLKEKRGLSGETIDNYMIGYAPDSWDSLLNHMRSRGFSVEEVVRQNLITKKEAAVAGSREFTDYFDRYRDRIMIPVNNHLGQIVGFAGRILHDDGKQFGKYINPTDTTPFGRTLYSKKHVLFGLDKAAHAISDAGEVILTEGYFHQISSNQAGLLNVVAAGGTAFTEEQASLLKRYADRMLIVLDPDAAGVKAARVAAQRAYGAGFSPKFGILPEGMDLDDVARVNRNKDAILDKIRIADIPDFIGMTSSLDRADADSAHKVLEEIVSFFSMEDHVGRKLVWISRTAELLGVSSSVVHEYMKRGIAPEPVVSARDDFQDVLARSFVYYVSILPRNFAVSYFKEFPPESKVFSSQLRKVYELIISEAPPAGLQQEFSLGNHVSPQLSFESARREDLFYYYLSRFRDGRLGEFPLELQQFLVSPPKMSFKNVAKALKIYVDELHRQDLVRGLVQARQTNDSESERKFAEELRNVTS